MAVTETLGLLGFGNMGSAILQGLLKAKTVSAKQVWVYDVSAAKRKEAQEFGVKVAEEPGQLLEQCEVVLLLVKPQNMASALDHFEKEQEVNTLFISVAAGVTINYLAGRLGEEARVARVMPNTPALVSCGAAGIALGPRCTERDGAIAREIFEAVGIAEAVTEQQIDVVTALSGSGPAYFFYMVECLVHAAVAQGLPEKTAQRLAAQTLLGAGRLLTESDVSPAVLRERVTSKGGTTEAALQCFEDGAFAELVQEAVNCAVDRARQLAKS